MASKALCCTAEQDDRSSSPTLPNARMNNATPAKVPLLPKRADSEGSRFTSARSEDLHELQQIFDNAKDRTSNDSGPPKSRFIRPSIHSLHSLQKVKSVHALIKRRLSKDLSKTAPGPMSKTKGPKEKDEDLEADTVLRVTREGPNFQLKITKSDLRKDLLSDKKREEGGYDSDAEALEDIARRVSKKSPSKRTSLHSIDWKTNSPESKQTPDSGRSCKEPEDAPQPYHLKPSETAGKTPVASRFTQFSSPNFRIKIPGSKERKLRRSMSAASAQRPPPSPVSPLRLPSLDTEENEFGNWSVSIHESLRLSRFPRPPSHVTPKSSRMSLRSSKMSLRERKVTGSTVVVQRSQTTREASRPFTKDSIDASQSTRSPFQMRVQEPTASPRPSTSVKENTRRLAGVEAVSAVQEDTEEVDNSRRSIHLQSMRISHHLRSGSLLSWDDLAHSADLPSPPKPFRERTVSDQSRNSQSASRSRHDRQHTSSSGFASAKVPSRWGKVVVQSSHHDASGMSSVYSSRPHSPPDSLEGSIQHLPMPLRPPEPAKSPIVHAPPSDANTSATAIATTPSSLKDEKEEEEIPEAQKRQSLPSVVGSHSPSVKDRLFPNKPLARNNSVAETKKSKFHEEFSPSPPRKRSTPTMSLMKMLLPRNSLRSRSEATLKEPKPKVDGAYDYDEAIESPARKRQVSRSMTSMQKEQRGLLKDKESNPVWEKALRAYQDERSSLFLPKNKSLAAVASPFRERSGSVAPPRSPSARSESPTHTHEDARVSPLDADDVAPDASGLFPPSEPRLSTRRSALVQADPGELSPVMEIQAAFDKQTDTKETVGAWGRYPSHTRPDRTGSAGHVDSVQTRDFALEAAIRFAKGEDQPIAPIARPSSSRLGDGKKKKRRIGSQRMAKSNSMTFGKTLLKNYAKMFRSQSTEFQRHGYGHRTSIAAGGNLEYPELEILPDIWAAGIREERSREDSGESMMSGALDGGRSKGKGKQKAETSMSTLGPLGESSTNRAKVWSAYYEDCVPAFTRGSTDIDSLALANLDGLNEGDLDDFAPTPMRTPRRSFDSRRPSLRTRTLPVRVNTVKQTVKHHSRHASHLSRASVASAVASFVSLDVGEQADEGRAFDAKSVVSVRRSTMDLLSKYREDEATERERVLSLMRVESLSYGRT